MHAYIYAAERLLFRENLSNGHIHFAKVYSLYTVVSVRLESLDFAAHS